MGLPHAYDTPADLVASDEIDLVVVTVKVPFHNELVRAALEAGKHVHCEWPLGNGLEQARELTRLADEKGVVATVGTELRTAPELHYLRQLVADGYVGEVLSTTLIGSGGNWGAETIADLAYLSDKSNGANMLTIPFGHTLAGVRDVLGDFADLSGRLLKRRDRVHVTDTDETIESTADDQIMVHGVMASGAAFSAHYRGGLSRGTNFLWEINGTRGDLQVRVSVGHAQMTPLSLWGAQRDASEMKPLPVPECLYAGLPEEVIVRNVAGIYALIAEDITTGSRKAPSFNDGLKLHEWLDVIEKTSQQLESKSV
nr:Gfo/Idh/MocA family oxidoreductase [uncultured Desulfuromonas sp.]